MTPVRPIPSGPSPLGWHSLETFARCPQEAWYAQRLAPREPPNREALVLGTLFHAGRAAWFSDGAVGGPVGDLAWLGPLAEREWPEATAEARASVVQRATSLIRAYIDWWGPTPAPKVVGVEHELGPAPLLRRSPVLFTTRMDLVARYPTFGGGLWWSEAKTTSLEPSAVVMKYRLHPQVLTGLALWRTAPQGEAAHGPLAGVLLDIVQKGYGGKAPRFSRMPIEVAPSALNWFARWATTQRRAMARMEAGGPVHRNPMSCVRTHGRMHVPCPYLPVCAYGDMAGFVQVGGG